MNRMIWAPKQRVKYYIVGKPKEQTISNKFDLSYSGGICTHPDRRSDKIVYFQKNRVYDDMKKKYIQTLKVDSIASSSASVGSHYMLKMHTRGLYFDYINFNRDFNVSVEYNYKDRMKLNLTTYGDDIIERYFETDVLKARYKTWLNDSSLYQTSLQS